MAVKLGFDVDQSPLASSSHSCWWFYQWLNPEGLKAVDRLQRVSPLGMSTQLLFSEFINPQGAFHLHLNPSLRVGDGVTIATSLESKGGG